MNKIKFPSLLLISLPLLFVTTFCSNNPDQQTDQQYQQEIRKWHQQRASSLTEEDSWLTLAGLYTLPDGTHTFGADSSNDIIFPAKAAAQIGTITKKDSSFGVQIKQGITVMHDTSRISSMQLQTDLKDEPTTLRHNDLLWYIIERRGTYYLRLKDTDHPNLTSFSGIKHFPVTKRWRKKAQFIPFDKPKVISIPDVMGEVYQDSLYGMLEFNINGQDYSISPLGHPENDEEFFIIFGDQTNGESTYSGGRYMYVSTPDENNITHIDFNKAYNPPCVFTNFATCPLPPTQNRLDVKITAGEKMYNNK
ncbi:hypothetical protein LX73_0429 [Fodinibius salinus]|uniref:DUF1684 domain-containing protein n=1 Tax=Fodinibius salinus TaxID=860790 RepID=A0A5D3YMN0_9BACT|nr:DUF1684 domain-containing protein [Fodinibius salinus]TYP95134.1 hypothetical protein LX73_0429 [Fodinibius salinus]